MKRLGYLKTKDGKIDGELWYDNYKEEAYIRKWGIRLGYFRCFADPGSPFIAGDVVAYLRVEEDEAGNPRRETLWCGHVSTDEAEDGKYVLYNVVLENLPREDVRWLHVTSL